MRKITLLSMSVVLTLTILMACSNASNTTSEQKSNSSSVSVAGNFDPAQIKTMGDFFKFKNDDEYNSQDSITETHYVIVLNIGGVYYRAIADLTPELSDKLFQLDFEERDQKLNELIGPLPVSRLENLTEMIPSQEELDKYVGKTGKELFDNGWSTYMYYNLEDMVAGLYHGPFLYDVAFEYDGEPMQNTDDFDFIENFKDLKVKSVKFAEIGDATDIGEE